MKIIVCIKQVPDTTDVKLDPKTGTLIREGIPSIINHDDKNALEEALRLKDQTPGAEVIVMTMGPAQADVALREALAMGADSAILISDRAFAGSDTWATSLILKAAVNKIADYDIIFCGRQAIDGDTAQVGPQLAEKLGIPQVTYVQKLDIKDNKVICQRALEDGYQVISSNMPVVLTAIKELNEPRYASVGGIFDAYEKKITIWTLADLDVDPKKAGLNGSPTNVAKTFTPDPKGAGHVENFSEGTALAFVDNLKTRHII